MHAFYMRVCIVITFAVACKCHKSMANSNSSISSECLSVVSHKMFTCTIAFTHGHVNDILACRPKRVILIIRINN